MRVVLMRINLTKKMKGWNYSSLPCCPVCLFCCFFVLKCAFWASVSLGQLEQMTFSGTDILCWFWQTQWGLVSRICLCYFHGQKSCLHPWLLHGHHCVYIISNIMLLALCDRGWCNSDCGYRSSPAGVSPLDRGYENSKWTVISVTFNNPACGYELSLLYWS